MRSNDVVFGTYSGPAMYLSKGGDLRKIIGELHGKETGCARRNGGSMHLIDIQKGSMGTYSIVDTMIPLLVNSLLIFESMNL